MIKTRIGMIAIFVALSRGLGDIAEQVRDNALQWQALSGSKATKENPLKDLDIDFTGLGGRVFLFYAPSVCVYEGTPVGEIVAYAKSLGATDIIFNGAFVGSIGKMIGVRGPLPKGHYPFGKPNWLEDAAEACRKEKLGLWIMIHGLEEGKLRDTTIVKERAPIYAYDDAGAIYNVVGDKTRGGCYDLRSENAFRYLCDQVDFFEERLRASGCFRGFFMDEFWFNYQANYFQPYFQDFSDFCEKNFGERPPAEIRDKIGKRGNWHDIRDPWWRRYAVWRERIVNEFEKRFFDYIASKGLKTINQRCCRGIYNREYAWQMTKGVDNARLGDYCVDGWKQSQFVTANAANICWGKGPQATNHVRMITGKPLMAFTLWHAAIVDPAFMTDSRMARILDSATGQKTLPRVLDEVRGRGADNIHREWKLLFRDSRRWQGGVSLADTGVLLSDRGNTFESMCPGDTYNREQKIVAESLKSKRPVRLVDISVPEYFRDYKVLVVCGSALKYLSKDEYAALAEWIRNGGVLIAVQATAAISLADGSPLRDVFETLTGTRLGADFTPTRLRLADGVEIPLRGQIASLVAPLGDTRILATMIDKSGNETPGITSRKWGDGMVLNVHFNLNDALLGETRDGAKRIYSDLLEDLIEKYAGKQPALRVDGQALVEECLKKGEDIVATFYTDYAAPATGSARIRADMLDAAGQYVVYRLAEGKKTPVPMRSGETLWPAEALSSEGVPVEILPSRMYQLIEIEKKTSSR